MRPRDSRRHAVGERTDSGADVTNEADAGGVHGMIPRARAKLHHPSDLGVPHVSPAGPHLNGVIAGKNDQIRCANQRQQVPIRGGRQAGTAERQRVVFCEHALRLVGGHQRDGKALDEIRNGACSGVVQDVEPGNHQRPLALPKPSPRLIEIRTRRRRARRGSGRARIAAGLARTGHR